MKTGDIAEEAFTAISTNKVRSGLTILWHRHRHSLGDSPHRSRPGPLQASITAKIEAAGANLLTVAPGAQRSSGMVRGAFGGATTLTPDDSNAIIASSNWSRPSPPSVTGRYQSDRRLEQHQTSR